MLRHIFLRRTTAIISRLGLFFSSVIFVHATLAQELIDRIAARVENDIILLSDVRHLGRYQMLVDGKSETEPKLLDRLIDQWVVQNEADASRFPRPTDAEIESGLEVLRKSFGSPQEYEERKKRSGLSDLQIRDKIATQL